MTRRSHRRSDLLVGAASLLALSLVVHCERPPVPLRQDATQPDLKSDLLSRDVARPEDRNIVDLVAASSVQVTPSSAELLVGTAQRFSAWAFQSGVKMDVTDSAKWDSSDPAVVQMKASPKGTAVAIKAGTAFISATYAKTVSPPAKVVVCLDEYSAIEVTPWTATIPVGHTLQLTAVLLLGCPGTTTNVTTTATWSSTNPSVATVNSTGLVTAIASGFTMINASHSGMNRTATIAVE